MPKKESRAIKLASVACGKRGVKNGALLVTGSVWFFCFEIFNTV